MKSFKSNNSGLLNKQKMAIAMAKRRYLNLILPDLLILRSVLDYDENQLAL